MKQKIISVSEPVEFLDQPLPSLNAVIDTRCRHTRLYVGSMEFSYMGGGEWLRYRFFSKGSKAESVMSEVPVVERLKNGEPLSHLLIRIRGSDLQVKVVFCPKPGKRGKLILGLDFLKEIGALIDPR